MRGAYLVVVAVLACSEGAEPSGQDPYCDRHSCPETLDQALDESCDDSEGWSVVEFDDGTICVGWFNDFSGSGNCYVNGLLSGAITYADVIVEGEDSVERHGSVPNCLWLAGPCGDPKLTRECFPCLEARTLEAEEFTCGGAEYLENLRAKSR